MCPECGLDVPASAPLSSCPACLLRIGLEGNPGSVVLEKAEEGGEAEDASIQIGPYQLIRVLGEGGMGTVWLARQCVPVRREVALKLVKEGVVTPESLERFELERQVLERLDHPGIARLLDAGQTSGGRPYFVMERVDGIPLNDFCRSRKLTVKERVELFLQVGEAVEYAHQRAVIHRDLKPLNVLVDEDIKPRALVIDFVIAKVLVDPLLDTSALTLAGGQVGTPSYMSPEQAGGRGVETRSDIYSLGAILFELLTGERLITQKSLEGMPPDEIYRRIREEEAERPSARLNHLTKDEQTSRAEDFSEPFERWQRQLRGDLDWVVLKSLEKDPARRYKSVGSLLEDLQRFLNDEMVVARPPSLSYRFRKFVHRRRSLAASILFAVMVLTAATALSMRWAFRAAEAARLAEDRLSEEAAVPTFLFDSFRLPSSSPDRSGMLAVDVLDYAAKSAPEEFANQPAIQGRVLEAIGKTYFDLGFYAKASAALSKAEMITRPIPDKTADLRGRLSQFNSEALRLDRKSDRTLEISERSWREAREFRGVGSSEEIAARQEYTRALITLGNPELAQKHVAEVRADREHYRIGRTGGHEDYYALVEFARGNKMKALAHYEGRVQKRLGLSEIGQDTNLMWSLRYYTAFLQANGKEEEAVRWTEFLTRACEGVYGLQHPLTLEAYARLARLYRSNGAPMAAWLIFRLHFEGFPVTELDNEPLSNLSDFSMRIDQETGVATRLSPWLDVVTGDPLALPDLPRGIEEEEIWFVVAEFRARAGAFAGASGAYRKGLELSTNDLPYSLIVDTTRDARYLELLLEEGNLDEVATTLRSLLESFNMTDLAERLYLEPLSKLISKLDLSGRAEEAREFDFHLMTFCAEFGAIFSGRLLASYGRLLKAVMETREMDRVGAFHRETLSLLREKLPTGHSLLETIWLRLAEFQFSTKEIESALATMAELEKALAEVDRAEDAPIRLHLMMLQCECYLRKKELSKAEDLLATLEAHFDRATSPPSTSEEVLREEKWRKRLTRSRDLLTRLRERPPDSEN